MAIKFLEKDDILGKYVKNIEPPKININEDYFFSLCRYIIFQQLSIKSASATFSRFTSLLNNNISAEQVLKQKEKISMILYTPDLEQKMLIILQDFQ